MRTRTGTTEGAAMKPGFAVSREMVASSQCCAQRDPSEAMAAFICAMATGSTTGPAHANADTAACANTKAMAANSAAAMRKERLMGP